MCTGRHPETKLSLLPPRRRFHSQMETSLLGCHELVVHEGLAKKRLLSKEEWKTPDPNSPEQVPLKPLVGKGADGVLLPAPGWSVGGEQFEPDQLEESQGGTLSAQLSEPLSLEPSCEARLSGVATR